MAFTTSPNMSLVIPTVGSEPGPQYATDVNNSLTIIDSHNHSPGSGVQITPSGLNISSDLSMQGNALVTINSLFFQELPTPLSTSLIDRLYDVNGNLYFNDGVGNQIPITANGAVAGTPGSIANLTPPASASYVSSNSTFVFQSNTNTPANLDGASINLRNLVANSFALTLSPPTLGSNYTITLPTLPSVQSFVTLDAAGNMSAPWQLDNMTLNLSGNLIEVAPGGITNTQIANQTILGTNIATNTITGSQIAVNGILPANLPTLNQVVSASSGAFTTSSTSNVLVTNLSVSITTSGRPVMILIQGDGTANGCNFGTTNTISGGVSGTFFFSSQLTVIRDGSTTISAFEQTNNLYIPVGGSGGTFSQTNTVPSGMIDSPTAGTHTYQVDLKLVLGANAFMNNAKLAVYEL